MRNLILLGLLVMFLVSIQFASAQTVDEIIDKYILARGGFDKLSGIKSIHMEGRHEAMGSAAMVKVIKAQGALSRTAFETANNNGFTLVTEKEAWSYFPMRAEQPEKISDESALAMGAELDIAGPLVDYVAKGYIAELLGKESLEGVLAYKIKLTAKTGVTSTHWIDTSNYLLVRSTTTSWPVPGFRTNPEAEQLQQTVVANSITTSLIYEDYKSVDGILFAHSIETKSSGADSGTDGVTIFDVIELNKPVDEKWYKPS